MLYHPYLRTSEKRYHYRVWQRNCRGRRQGTAQLEIKGCAWRSNNQDHCDCEQLNPSSQCKGDVGLTHVIADIEISAERDGELNSGDTEVEAEDRRDLSNTADVSVQYHLLLPFSARYSQRTFGNNLAAVQYYIFLSKQ